MVDSSGFNVAGVVHENEWVSPKWMAESPKYARTISWLESERLRGRGFADGGYTSSMPASAGVASDINEQMLLRMDSMNNNLISFRQEISQWQRELVVSNNLVDMDNGLKALNQVRTNAGGF